MAAIIAINREAWLQAAVSKLRPMFQGHNLVVPELQVSVGWPSSGGLGTRKRAVGECWFGETTADKKAQLFISPLLHEAATPQGVLATLAHEMVHVVAGFDAKHGPKFVKVMKKIGLDGKATATIAGEDLLVRIQQIAEELGDFPHSAIVPSPKDAKKKQTTRMKKVECADCSYVARTVQKWLDERGAPICPCNMQPMQIRLNVGEDAPEGSDED